MSSVTCVEAVPQPEISLDNLFDYPEGREILACMQWSVQHLRRGAGVILAARIT